MSSNKIIYFVCSNVDDFRFLTPDFAATMIVGVGTVLFGWKILEYYLSKKRL